MAGDGRLTACGAVDATIRRGGAWTANELIRNAGDKSAILGLSTDGTTIYGNGYVYTAAGNLEGVFAADPNTAPSTGSRTATATPTAPSRRNGTGSTCVSHAHYCGNVGGLPQTGPLVLPAGAWPSPRTPPAP